MRHCVGPCDRDLEDQAFHRGHSICRDCRSSDYYRKRGLTCSSCDLCGRVRPLSKSGHCHGCNEIVFLRECRLCVRVLDLKFFYGHKRLCKRCLKLSRGLTKP
jgi:hypothetical protein